MEALRILAGDRVTITGVGGPAMAAQGLQSLFPLNDTAVMGLREVVPRFRKSCAAFAMLLISRWQRILTRLF